MGSPSCVCQEAEINGNPYVPWMAEAFGDCAYSNTEQWAVYLGLASTAVWLVAQAPQIYKNFRLKQVDGISGAFLATWLSGDTTNLLGCITTAAFKTQLYSAVYFCSVDIILLSQYAYYRYIYPTKPIEMPHLEQDEKWTEEGDKIANESATAKAKSVTVTKRISLIAAALIATGLLIGLVAWNANRNRGDGSTNQDGIPFCDPEPVFPMWEYVLGIIFSWSSGTLYFLSRVPQILQNFRRKTVHGLSIIMFALAITANLCYGFSIVFKLPEINTDFWATRFPFLVGSLGTLVFDGTIMLQTYLYGWAPPVEETNNVDETEMIMCEADVNMDVDQ